MRKIKLSKPAVISIIAITLVLLSTAILGLTNIFAQTKIDNLVDRRDVGTFVPNKPYDGTNVVLVGSIKTRIIEIPFDLWQKTRDTMEETNGKEGNSHEQGKDFLSYFYKNEEVEPYMIIGDVTNDIYEVDGDANYYVVDCRGLDLIDGSIYYFMVANNNNLAELKDVSKYYFDDDNDILYLSKDLLDVIIEKDAAPLRSEALVVCENIESATKRIRLNTVFSEDVEAPKGLQKAVINETKEFHIRDCQFDCVKYQLVEPDGLAYISERTVFVYVNGTLFEDWMYNEVSGEIFLGLDPFETRDITVEIKCINDVTKEQIKMLKSIQNNKDMVPSAGVSESHFSASNPFFTLQYGEHGPRKGDSTDMSGVEKITGLSNTSFGVGSATLNIGSLGDSSASWATVNSPEGSRVALENYIPNENIGLLITKDDLEVHVNSRPNDCIDSKTETTLETDYSNPQHDAEGNLIGYGTKTKTIYYSVKDELKGSFLVAEIQYYLNQPSPNIAAAQGLIDKAFTNYNTGGYYNPPGYSSLCKPANRVVDQRWESAGATDTIRYFAYTNSSNFLGGTVKSTERSSADIAVIDGDCCHIARSENGIAGDIEDTNHRTIILDTSGSNGRGYIIACLYGTATSSGGSWVGQAQRIQSYTKIDYAQMVNIKVDKKVNGVSSRIGGAKYTLNGPGGEYNVTTWDMGQVEIPNVICGHYTVTETRAPKGYVKNTNIQGIDVGEKTQFTFNDPYQLQEITIKVCDKETHENYNRDVGVGGLTFTFHDRNGKINTYGSDGTTLKDIVTDSHGEATFYVRTLDCEGGSGFYLEQTNIVENYKRTSECYNIDIPGTITPTDDGTNTNPGAIVVTHYEARQHVKIHTHVQDEHKAGASSAVNPSGGDVSNGTRVSLVGSTYQLIADAKLLVGYDASGNSLEIGTNSKVHITKAMDLTVNDGNVDSYGSGNDKVLIGAEELSFSGKTYLLPTGKYKWRIITPSHGYSSTLVEQKIEGTEWDEGMALEGKDIEILAGDNSYVRQRRQTVSIDVLTKGYEETSSLGGGHLRTNNALRSGFLNYISQPFNNSITRVLQSSNSGGRPDLSSSEWAKIQSSTNRIVKSTNKVNNINVAITNLCKIYDVEGNEIPAGSVIRIVKTSAGGLSDCDNAFYGFETNFSGNPVRVDSSIKGVYLEGGAIKGLPNGKYALWVVAHDTNTYIEEGLGEDINNSPWQKDNNNTYPEELDTSAVLLVKNWSEPSEDDPEDDPPIPPAFQIRYALDLPVSLNAPYYIGKPSSNILIGDVGWQNAISWIDATDTSADPKNFVPRVGYRIIDKDNIGEYENSDKTFVEVVDPLPTTFAYYLKQTEPLYAPNATDSWSYYTMICDGPVDNPGNVDFVINNESPGYSSPQVTASGVGDNVVNGYDFKWNHRIELEQPVTGAFVNPEWLDNKLRNSPNGEIEITIACKAVVTTTAKESGEVTSIGYPTTAKFKIVGRNMFMLD